MAGLIPDFGNIALTVAALFAYLVLPLLPKRNKPTADAAV